MRTLRGLADDGRTVVVVTHNVANLDVCDRLLLLAPGGTVAYFGPPQEALAYFGVADFADLFLLLEREAGADWGERFRRSAVAERYIGTPPPTRAPGPYGVPTPAPTTAPAAPPRQQSALAQFGVLARRYLAVIGADRQYTIFMVALPLLLAALSHALPVDTGLSLAEQLRGVPGAPQSLLMVFIVGAALMGSAASIRELVKEREIYRRERAIGLSRAAYLLSKVVVLGVITGLQGLVLGVLGTLGRPGPDEAVVLGDPRVEILVAIAATTIASMAVGLAVSAWIDNADRGMPLLVLLAMLQFILSSALLQIQDSPVLAQLVVARARPLGLRARRLDHRRAQRPGRPAALHRGRAPVGPRRRHLAVRPRCPGRRHRAVRRRHRAAAAPPRPARPEGRMSITLPPRHSGSTTAATDVECFGPYRLEERLGGGEHGRGVPRLRHGPRAHRRPQAPAPRPLRRRGVRRARPTRPRAWPPGSRRRT